MTELSTEARTLIERVGGADGPDAERRKRVKRHLVAALASAGAGFGGMTQVAAAAAHAGTTGVVSGALGAKSAISVGSVAIWLATGAAAGALVSAPAVVMRLRAVTPAQAPHVAVPPRALGLDPPVAPPAPVEVPAPSLPPEPIAKPKAQPMPALPSLAEETRLLESAQRELAAARPSAALALLDEHSRRFSHGALAEEQTLARVLSLCALGRTEDARRAAAAFFVSWPSSPLVPRLRGSCAVSQTASDRPLSR